MDPKWGKIKIFHLQGLLLYIFLNRIAMIHSICIIALTISLVSIQMNRRHCGYMAIKKHFMIIVLAINCIFMEVSFGKPQRSL